MTKLNISSLQNLFIDGVRLHQSGRLIEAEALYRQVLEADPRHADCLHLLGVVATQSGRHEEAVELIGRAIAENGASAQFHANLGTSLRSLERFAEAEAVYRRAIEIKPDYADAHNHLGTTLRDLGRPDEAERSLREAVRLRPDYGDAQNNLGNLLRETARLEEAEQAYRLAMKLIPPQHPRFAVLLRNLAAVLHDLDRNPEAEAACRASLQREPQDPATHDSHATVLRELDQHDVAEAAQRRAVALEPDNGVYYLDYALLLKAMGRVSPGETICRRSLQIDATNVDAVNCLGGLLFDLGRMAEAEETMRRSLEMAPEKASFHLSYAATHRYREGDDHIADMERLAARAEDFPDLDGAHLHFALAKAYEDVGASDLGFDQLLLGNAAKRRTFEYDEADTLGQIERIKQVFTKEFINRHKRGFKLADGPIFILGMMRSGSTLVEQILASHPQVFGAGELTLFRQALAGQIGQQARYPDAVLNMSPAAIDAVGVAYEARLRQEAPSFKRITDKYLHNFLYCGLIALALPHARIIHTVRNPVDTCLSIHSKLFTGHHPYAYDLAELGRYHRAYQSLMDHWRQVLPEGIMIDLAYEDLVGDLEGQARRLLDHCDLPWDDACLAFHRTDRAVRTASATQVRQPIYKSSVGRWKPTEALLRPLTDALI